MKKNISIALFVIACVAMASPSFAAMQLGPGTTATTIFAGANLTPSTGVGLYSVSGDTAYCVTTVHNNATGQAAGIEFGATSFDATIKTKSASGLTASTSAGGAAEACTAVTTGLPTGM